jgi:transposase
MAWRRGQAYSQDLRERVLAADGEPIREVAERLSVSPSYVVKVRARLRATGERAARPQRGQLTPRLLPFTAALRARLAEVPDAATGELQTWVAEECGVRVSYPVMWLAVARLGLRRKKPRPAKLAVVSRRGGIGGSPGGA